MALKVEAAARTDVGRVRRSNQDSFGMDEGLGLFVVCDGMGGAAGGDVASSLAVGAFLETARQELASQRDRGHQATCVALQRATAAANRAVVARAAWDICFRGMGSTLVAVRVVQTPVEPQAVVINVGDSRAYRVRDGAAVQVTEDHSFVAEQLRLGLMTAEQAERSNLQSVITRAIGADADVRPDVFTVELEAGDVLLLVSDGLTRHVSDEELGGMVAAGVGLPVDSAAQALIDCANDRGGSDNITCVVLRFAI